MFLTTHRPRRTTRLVAAGASVLLSVGLAACGSDTTTSLPNASGTAATSAAPTLETAAATTTTTTVASPDTTPDAPPTTTVEPTTVPPTTVPPSTVPAPTWAPFVAIDAAGDAVLIGSDGATTLLYDGTSLDEPLPEEGPVVYVRGVDVSADGSTAYVGLCCEPSPGTILMTAVPAIASYETSNPMFGHEPILSPDGTRLAAITTTDLMVRGVDGTDLGSAALDGLATDSRFVRDVAWIDSDSVVALVVGVPAIELHAFDVAGGVLTPTHTVTVPFGASSVAELVTLASSGDGLVYVFGLDTATVVAFAGDTLAAAPASSIALPAAALSAVVDAGTVRWIDAARRLHVGDTVIAGSYVWVG
jgi:hypothetical protein